MIEFFDRNWEDRIVFLKFLLGVMEARSIKEQDAFDIINGSQDRLMEIVLNSSTGGITRCKLASYLAVWQYPQTINMYIFSMTPC